eukprot:gnl/MRDRNA2_/MRDRNA2_161007_c0_seq1.p1 gnl/MRDRNA2_/MRDRNA2_161007_c0~~gnl/MRDRNA2_/MRDRNA2_161007_c0_seq1.p1  ORF type:complete len:453 (+),score=65.62 gnl/MRDRNA2_/MRDRNA2_161007_c0_seq1:94-1452(+)
MAKEPAGLDMALDEMVEADKLHQNIEQREKSLPRRISRTQVFSTEKRSRGRESNHHGQLVGDDRPNLKRRMPDDRPMLTRRKPVPPETVAAMSKDSRSRLEDTSLPKEKSQETKRLRFENLSLDDIIRHEDVCDEQRFPKSNRSTCSLHYEYDTVRNDRIQGTNRTRTVHYDDRDPNENGNNDQNCSQDAVGSRALCYDGGSKSQSRHNTDNRHGNAKSRSRHDSDYQNSTRSRDWRGDPGTRHDGYVKGDWNSKVAEIKGYFDEEHGTRLNDHDKGYQHCDRDSRDHHNEHCTRHSSHHKGYQHKNRTKIWHDDNQHEHFRNQDRWDPDCISRSSRSTPGPGKIRPPVPPPPPPQPTASREHGPWQEEPSLPPWRQPWPSQQSQDSIDLARTQELVLACDKPNEIWENTRNRAELRRAYAAFRAGKIPVAVQAPEDSKSPSSAAPLCIEID